MRPIKYGQILMAFFMGLLFMLQGVPVSAETAYLKSKGVTLIHEAQPQVEGKIHLKGESEKTQIKLLIIKDEEKKWYELPLQEGKFDEEIWLTMGKGKYTAAIMIHEGNRKYSYGPKITVENIGDVNRFLVPAKHIESEDNKIRQLAEKIIEDKASDREKAKAIYDWVTANILYDYDKYLKHQEGNYDNEYGALHTLETKKGVCYDYATLTAALCRAAGLQTKVVKGQASNAYYNGYHAWNEVYLQNEDKWIFLDTTFAACENKEYFDNEKNVKSHNKQEEF
ncbi:Transglutaminase-like superfamily protein [Geosporobacter subterraneus DSM 17957]|uniref:Transglutaminase-like superfamily protein n=1 Tax=Geosporobacter subterraneus DSM 17957 TaxID=1121919 RepID=A0A1M6DHX7_9FIRM|nr:transglutaminase-like domain-containing protein [Geosporobacter subterraneus]SHI72731.1 Transglutaminase-like superfamily protein [Geosporobacter subterraneus DSM 17957]